MRADSMRPSLHLNQAIELEPQTAGPYRRLADVFEEMGRYAEAIAFHEKRDKVLGRAQDVSPDIARIYARMGKPDEARRILDLQRTTRIAVVCDWQQPTPRWAITTKPSACCSR